MASKLVKNQVKTFGPRAISGSEYGSNAFITATVRHDDNCGNGHNTFTITADIRIHGKRDIEAGGCLHEQVAKAFPELRPFIKWHLTSTDGPMHYIANTVYWAERGKLENARSTAIWPDATLEQLVDVELLQARLPELLANFQRDVEALGFTY